MGVPECLYSPVIGAFTILLIYSLLTPQILVGQQANISQQSPFTNFTGSIPLANSLLDVLKSKVTLSLIDAMNNVTNSLGPNTTLLSGSIQPEVGFLVYRIAALDGNNTIQMFLVDPGNGTVLSHQQFPAAMSQILSSEPGPQLGTIPNLGVP